MKRSDLITYLALPLLMLGSCQKEEPLWQLSPPGAETISSVTMGPAYEKAVYFQLATGHAEERDVFIWDLAFATGENEHHIVLNGAKEIQVFHTGETDFAKKYPIPAAGNWKWDNPNGDPDSTAIGNWLDSNNISLKHVYVIDWGKNALIRYQKLQLISYSASQYTFKLAELDEADIQPISVTKNKQSNFTYFNAELREEISFEPPSSSWDLLFTRYRYVYYDMDPITPYQVNGALINTKRITACETTNLKFEEITAENAAGLLLHKKADEIGYDWKFFDLNGSGKYLINTKKVYILRDDNGYLYKLRFLDFYDSTGAKGTPKFAFQRL